MAKDESFDVVSQVDLQEVDNAVQQATKELVQRYDLKDTHSTITLDKHEATVAVTAPIEMEIARKINKDMREEKYKVRVQIEGDKVRVFSPSRDELQKVITFLKQQDYGIPLQFVNYR